MRGAATYHQGTAGEEDADGEHDGLFPAPSLADWERQECAEKGAGLEGGDDVALKSVARVT